MTILFRPSTLNTQYKTLYDYGYIV